MNLDHRSVRSFGVVAIAILMFMMMIVMDFSSSSSLGLIVLKTTNRFPIQLEKMI